MKNSQYAVIKNGSIVMLERKENASAMQLTVSVQYCGICGTDLWKYRNLLDVQEWGHELLVRLDNGEFAVVRTTFPCGVCADCLSGKLCSKWRREEFSGFAEYVTLDKRSLIPIVRDDPVYTLAEPLNVAINMSERLNPTQDESCAIIGNAAIALLCAYWLRKKGLNVAIFSRNDSNVRRQFANQIGAQMFQIADMEKRISNYDIILNTAPYETIPKIMEYARDYARIAFNGIGGITKGVVDFQKWHYKNLTISSVFPHPQGNFKESINAISEDSDLLKQVISRVYPLKEIDAAFRDMESKEYIKVLVGGGKS